MTSAPVRVPARHGLSLGFQKQLAEMLANRGEAVLSYDLGEWSAREPAPGYRVDEHPADASGNTHRLWHHGLFVTSGERSTLCEQSWQTLMHYDSRIGESK